MLVVYTYPVPPSKAANSSIMSLWRWCVLCCLKGLLSHYMLVWCCCKAAVRLLLPQTRFTVCLSWFGQEKCPLGQENCPHIYLISSRWILRFFAWMSFGFIPKGCRSSKSFVGEATLLAFVADLVWCVFAGFLCGIDCWIGVTMIASGLLSVRRCCGVR